MLFSSWLRTRTPKSASFAPFRPRLEALDDRLVPSTLTVTNTLDDGSFGSLRGEIGLAQSGDTIVFDPSLNGQTITLGSTELAVGKNLDIEGPGAGSLTISGGGRVRVFDVQGVHLTLAGLTITGGAGMASSGFSSFPQDDGYGGAIINSGTLTMSGCTVSHSIAYYDGGGIANYGALSMSGCTVSSNTAYRDGGGVANLVGAQLIGTATLDLCTVTGNTAAYGSFSQGGGIYNAGTMTLKSCTVTGNAAQNEGGGIYNAAGANLSLLYSTVTGNTAWDGADVFNDGTLTKSHSKIGTPIGH